MVYRAPVPDWQWCFAIQREIAPFKRKGTDIRSFASAKGEMLPQESRKTRFPFTAALSSLSRWSPEWHLGLET